MKIIPTAALAAGLVYGGANLHAVRADEASSAEALQAARELVTIINSDTIKDWRPG